MAIKRPAEPSSPSSTAREAQLQLGRPHGDSRPHAVRPDRAGKEQGRPAREGRWSEAPQEGMCAASARHIVHHRTCAAARGHGLDMGRTPRRRQSKTLAGRRGALSGAASGGPVARVCHPPGSPPQRWSIHTGAVSRQCSSAGFSHSQELAQHLQLPTGRLLTQRVVLLCADSRP